MSSQTFSIPAYIVAVAGGSSSAGFMVGLVPLVSGGGVGSPTLLLFSSIFGLLTGTLIGLPAFLPWTIACLYIANKKGLRTLRYAALFGAVAACATVMSVQVLSLVLNYKRAGGGLVAEQQNGINMLGIFLLFAVAGAIAGLIYEIVNRIEFNSRDKLF